MKISEYELSRPVKNFHSKIEPMDSDTDYDKDSWLKYISSIQNSANVSISDESKAISSFSIDIKDLDIPIKSQSSVRISRSYEILFHNMILA